MCAIIDAQVSHEVFGTHPSPAGVEFFSWINRGAGRLVVGGKLFDELLNSGEGFRQWARQAGLAGRLRRLNDQEVQKSTVEIENEEKIVSDDPHVLAVARIGSARLLYSNDKDLHEDFGNRVLIDKPRGKVYSTLKDQNFTDTHKRLLNRHVCRVGNRGNQP